MKLLRWIKIEWLKKKVFFDVIVFLKLNFENDLDYEKINYVRLLNLKSNRFNLGRYSVIDKLIKELVFVWIIKCIRKIV